MWEIMIFKWFLQLKIQINFKKPGFVRKNQLRTWYHMKAYHLIQACFPFIFGCSKYRYIHCKSMLTCWVSLFHNGFTLRLTPQATLIYIKFLFVLDTFTWGNGFFGPFHTRGIIVLFFMHLHRKLFETFFFWVSCLQNLRCGLMCSSGVVQIIRLGLEKCLGRGSTLLRLGCFDCRPFGGGTGFW
jgi:hypothetical protein